MPKEKMLTTKVFECETCGDEYFEEKGIKKCGLCGKDVCHSCELSVDGVFNQYFDDDEANMFASGFSELFLQYGEGIILLCKRCFCEMIMATDRGTIYEKDLLSIVPKDAVDNILPEAKKEYIEDYSLDNGGCE